MYIKYKVHTKHHYAYQRKIRVDLWVLIEYIMMSRILYTHDRDHAAMWADNFL